MKIARIFLLIILIDFLSFSSNSIIYETEVTEKIPQQIINSLEYPQGELPQSQVHDSKESENSMESESRQNKPVSAVQTGLNYYEPNLQPIAINKYVMSSLTDDSYSNNTICVFVKINNNEKYTLSDIDLYETFPQDMDIINCSIPVKTNSMGEIIKYEKLNSNPIFYEDISNPRRFAQSLTNNDPLSEKLKAYFVEEDLGKLRNSSGVDENTLINIIVKGLNKAIIKSESDFPTQFNKDLDKIYSVQTKKLLELNRSYQLENYDRYLLNLFELRDLYPSYINKPDESLNILKIPIVDSLARFIHFRKFDLYPKESMIYVYYTNLSLPGTYKTNTNLRVPGSAYSEFNYPLFVTFYSPQFDVKVDLSELEVEPGENVILTYIVDFLNPINTSSVYKLNARIENLGNNMHVNKSTINLKFSRDNSTCEGAISLNFSKPGAYQIPALEIDNKKYTTSGGNIEVEALWHKYISELSLIFLALCSVVAANLHKFMSINTLKIIYAFLSGATATGFVILLELPYYWLFIIFVICFFLIVYLLVDLITCRERIDNSGP
jgi:hypothetical protein